MSPKALRKGEDVEGKSNPTGESIRLRVDASYPSGPGFESIAERKLRRAGVGEDGSAEIKVEVC